MKKITLTILCAAMILAWGFSEGYALTAGETYAITIQRMNSNGTVIDYSSTTATADGNGKLSFTLSSMPTYPDSNFLVFIVKDSNDTVVRKGFVPAPPAGDTNLLGINALSTAQTNAIIAAGMVIGTDDPIAIAYLLTILRSEQATTADATTLAALGNEAITGTGGFEYTLLASGVTAAQLSAFKGYLIYNPDSTKKTLRYLTSQFKEAVESNSTATGKELMQKAGGYMADLFMDAAESAGIEFSLVLAAHDAAGVVAGNATNQARMASTSTGLQLGMEQAMSSFFRRIAAVKVKSEYTKALTTLNASGTQVDTFTAAVAAMMTAMESIDADYAEYYSDPEGYIASHGTTQTAIRTAMDARYQAAFSGFQTAIQSSNADITAMKSAVAAAFGITLGQLPADFGTYIDFSSGTQKNWPIPQTVMVTWMAGIITAGGSLGYTRDSLSLPLFCTWMGSCSNTSYHDQTSCQMAGGTWTAGRRDYTGMTPSSSFNAYLGLMEDINIIEMNRYSIYQGGGTPTRDQEKAAKLEFVTNLESAAGRISGYVDGSSTPISTAQKQAIMKLLMQPSMD